MGFAEGDFLKQLRLYYKVFSKVGIIFFLSKRHIWPLQIQVLLPQVPSFTIEKRLWTFASSLEAAKVESDVNGHYDWHTAACFGQRMGWVGWVAW